MKERILDQIVDNLQRTLEIPVKWRKVKNSEDPMYDTMLEFVLNGVKLDFFTEVKREVRKTHLPQLMKQYELNHNFIVIAQYLYPSVRDELKKLNISYADNAGNVFVRSKQLYVYLQSNEGPGQLLNRSDEAFTKTSLMVILCFLKDEETLNTTYRELSKRAGVSIGLLTRVMRNLLKHGYLLKKDNRSYQFKDKTALFEKWAEHYVIKLKPSLYLGTFRWNITKFPRWEDLPLESVKNKWSGAVAADLLTKDLVPDTFTLYTGERIQEIMRSCQLTPDTEGNLKVYTKFWTNDAIDQTAPLPVVYADLVEHGTARYLEKAKTIYTIYNESA